MAYIGRDIEYGSFTKQTLTANSSTTAFALDQSVVDANSILVSVGGVIQEPDVAYTASGTVLTFTGTPTTGDPIWIVYLGKSLGTSTTRDAITYQAATGNGSATTVAMTSSGTTGTIIVTLNGVMQTPSTDFSVSGSTLTFTTAPFNGAAIGIHYLGKQARIGVPASGTIQQADLASSGTFPAWDGSALTGIVGVTKTDIFEIQNNIALLNFLRANDITAKRTSMLNGFQDQFRTTDGVDGESVSVPLTKFDGANDVIRTGSDLTGMADGLQGTFSCWIDFTGGDGVLQQFITNEGGYVQIEKATTNKFHIMISRIGGGGTKVWDALSSTTYTAPTGKLHFMSSWNGTTGTMYVNGVDVLGTNSKNTGTNADYTRSNWSVGADCNGAFDLSGSIGQVYFDDSYIDLTVAANRKKFYNSGAVDFGANGSTPTGSQPLIYLNNPHGTFQTNLGTGGNYTVTGEIVDGGYVTNNSYSSNSFTNSYEIVDHVNKPENQSLSIGGGITDSHSGQCLTVPAGGYNVHDIGFYTRRQGNFSTGTVYAEIRTIASGTVAGGDAIPSNSLLARSTGIAVSNLNASGTTFGVKKFNFPNGVILSASTDYWIGMTFTGGSGSTYVACGSITGGAADPNGHAAKRSNGGTWSAVTDDYIFYLYGQKNLDIKTKGTDDLAEVSSPSSAPTKGHIETIISGGKVITAKSYAPDTEDHGYTNSSIRVRYTATTSANKIRLKLKGALIGGSRSNTHLANISIGNQSGTSYNCTAVPTEILTAGVSGMVVHKGLYNITDWFDYTIVAGNSYLITFDFETDASNDDCSKHATAGDGAVAQGGGRTYNLANFGTIHATYSSGVFCLDSVETLGLPNINTDVKGEMSRDGGTTWSPSTLRRVDKAIAGSDYDVLMGDVDFTGDPSGTNIKARIKTVNKDKVTVKGIAVNWQ